MRQKYCRDLRGKKREGFDPQTSSPTLCIYVSRIAEISTNKRKFSNIDLPERAKLLSRHKEKNVKDLIHRHQALLYVSRITEISTNKRKFSNIDLPERAKVLPGL